VPVPRWPVPFVFPLRGGFVLPRGPGAVARAGPRAQPSDLPPHATEQERPALGPLAVRKKPTPATPHRGTPARDPHAPAQWLLSPAGRSRPPTLRLETLQLGTSNSPVPGERGRLAGGKTSPVPRVAGDSGARGYRTREPCRGDGGAASCERRGAPVRIALSGRGRRSLQAQGAGAPKPADGHRGTGKKGEPHAVNRELSSPRGKTNAYTQ